MKKDIKNFTLQELKEQMQNIKEPPYRAQQVFFWIYKKGVCDFNDMSNIPEALRYKLGGLYYISGLKLSEHLKSKDGTEKFLFKLSDANYIETVLIPAHNRETLCISTQVGCKYSCLFCASGLGGFIRNLNTSEIINQILFLQCHLKRKITNFVFMGMGEPFDNYENFLKAVMIMNDPDAMATAARRITVSTAGVIPSIEKFKNLGLQINLSISLHAANNKLRNELMPINKKYPLEALIRTCEDFIDKTKRKITLEYILIKGKNDSLKDANELTQIAKRLKAKINLIPYSNICKLNFESPRQVDIDTFMKHLMAKRANVTLRESKGKDIQAACGQLAGHKESSEKV